MKIGVFDSGVGGLSVAKVIEAKFPGHEVLFVEDHENLPYGTKTAGQLVDLVVPILQKMIDDGCEVIVIACNTVTTSIIEYLRAKLDVPLVGMEPMVKPAAQMTKTGTIAVFATPTTLSTKRYAWLKAEFASDVNVVEPDCSNWAQLVENNKINREDIEEDVNQALNAGADVMVLGCTHYHWIEDLMREIVEDKAVVIQPTEPVLEQLSRVIEQLG